MKGFTLIEVLIAIGILLVVGGVIVIFQQNFFFFTKFFQESFSTQNELRAAITAMVSQLRAAKISDTGSYPIEKAEANSIAFYANTDADALTERVQYFLNGADLKKSIIKPAGSPLTYATSSAPEFLSTIVRDIYLAPGAQIFSYYDSSYGGTSTPLVFPIDILKVRFVGINLAVDSTPGFGEPPITVSSQVNIRNLKTNF